MWDIAFPVYFYRRVGLRVPRLFLIDVWDFVFPVLFYRRVGLRVPLFFYPRVGLRVPRQPTCGTSCSPYSFIGVWDFVFPSTGVWDFVLPVFSEQRVGLRVPRILLRECGTSCCMLFYRRVGLRVPRV